MSSAPFPLSYLFGSFAVESSGMEQLPFSVRRSLLWGERVCLYYMRNGSCKYGSNYRFNHLDPTAAGGCDPPFGFDNGGPASLQWWTCIITMVDRSHILVCTKSLSETPLYVPMMMPPSQGVSSQNT